MTDTNTKVQEDKKDTATPVTATGTVSGEEKKVEVEEKKA